MCFKMVPLFPYNLQTKLSDTVFKDSDEIEQPEFHEKV